MTVVDAGLVGRRVKLLIMTVGIMNTLVQEIGLLQENNVSQPLCVAALCVSHQKLQMSTTTTVTAFLIRYLLRTWRFPDEFVLLKSDLQFRVSQRPDQSDEVCLPVCSLIFIYVLWVRFYQIHACSAIICCKLLHVATFPLCLQNAHDLPELLTLSQMPAVFLPRSQPVLSEGQVGSSAVLGVSCSRIHPVA